MIGARAPWRRTKLAHRGSKSRERIGVYRNRKPITIAMPYRVALL